MNTLEQKVLELIGEDPDNPDVFVDTDAGMAPIRDSINDAVSEIVMLTGGFKRQYFLPLREDTMFYRFNLSNGDLGWVTDVWLHNQQRRLEQSDLIRLNSYNPRWMISSGMPEAYLQLGQDIIGVYPKPSGSSDVLEVTIVEIPFSYSTDRDRVKLRDAYKYATVQYAVAEYWASRGDAQEATAHMQLYFDALGLNELYTAQSERSRSFQSRKDSWPTVTS